MTQDDLIEAALEARQRAHAPYSGFQVGAALEADDGSLFTGCNIENSSYGLTVCAERTAVFKAVSEGRTTFRRICVAARAERLTPPCGACRQVLWDLCGDIDVVLVNLDGQVETLKLSQLIPRPFDKSFL